MSDWALGKKLNSQIADVPLNHLIWLNDYKTYGEDSYVFQDKDVLHELYFSSCALNDMSINAEAIKYATLQNQIGVALSKIYGMEKTVNWENFKTVDDLVSNADIISQVISNHISLLACLGVLSENELAMNAICNSQIALSILYDNYLCAEDYFSNSPYLLSACEASSLYEVTVNNNEIQRNATSARRTHYGNKCFIVGMSQAMGTGSGINSLVDIFEETLTSPSEKTNGKDGLKWRINKFASSAKCHPYSSSSNITDTANSYMAILKIA